MVPNLLAMLDTRKILGIMPLQIVGSVLSVLQVALGMQMILGGLGDDFYISERQFGSFSQSIRPPHGIHVEISPQASRRVFLPLRCPRLPPRRRSRVISTLNRDSRSPALGADHRQRLVSIACDRNREAS